MHNHNSDKNHHGQMKHKVAGQNPDTASNLAGDKVPDHKMFHKAKKKANKGKMKAKMKAKMRHGRMLKGKKSKGKRKHVQGRQWHLIKKNNGQCKCTQRVRGRLSLRKFTTSTECENHRNGC